MTTKRLAVLKRFGKGLAAVVLASVIAYFSSPEFSEAASESPLVLALVGLVAPLLLALEKYIRWQEDPPEQS